MKERRSGFILLELIVALTILGIGFSVLFAGMSESTRNIGRLEKFQDRQFLIRNLLAQLQLVQQLRTGDSAHGTFEDGTRWRIEVRPFVVPANETQNSNSIVRLDLRLEWDGKSGLQTKTIETYRFVKGPAQTSRGLEEQLRALD